MFKLYTLFKRHKALAFFGLFIYLCIVGYLASRITLEEDISNLIPAGERQATLQRVLEHTDFSDKIIVSISSTSTTPNPEELTQYAQGFLDSVNLKLPEYIKEIQGKVPEEEIREIYNFIYQNLPLFLNEEDYKTIDARLQEAKIQSLLQENYKNLISPTGLVTKEFIFKDPLSLTALGLKKLEELQIGDDFEIYNSFLISKDHKHVILVLSPNLPASETKRNTVFVSQLEDIMDQLNTEFDGVKGEFFGGVLYGIANATQIKRDIQITVGIAGAILLLILIIYYRRIYVPLVIFIPSIIGGLTAIAALFILKGTVSSISLGIGAILLGISIDYSLHILTHLRNNNNIKKLYNDVTGPVLLSSFTTAIAFLCLLFLKSEALKDLGIFAGVSVVTASFFALVLIPLFYKAPVKEVETVTFIDKIAAINFHNIKPLVYLVTLMFIGGLFYFTNVKFNRDLSALNFAPEEIQQREANVMELAGKASKSIFLVSYGNSVDEALEYNNNLYRDLQDLEAQGDLISYSSIGGIVLSTTTQLNRIERWKDFWSPEKKEQVAQSLVENSTGFGFRPESFQNFYQLLDKDFEPLYLEDYRSTSTLYLDDFIQAGNNFATVSTTINVEPESFEKILREFEERDHVILVDRQQINESFLGNLKNEFNRLIGFSLIAVFIVLLLFYRSLALTLLTLLPIGITWIITLGVMAILGIEFNILNIIISTFIFGLGLDYSIFITNAFLKEYETGTHVLKTYRTSILLSVLTTLLGIGALFFAEHPALRSVSVVSIIGIISALMVSFVIQAYIFQVFFLDRKKQGRGAFSFRNLFDPSKYNGRRDKLYFKKEIFNNYRYKKDFRDIKKQYENEKERYLKVADLLEINDNVIIYPSGKGLLAIYLNYKAPGTKITGFETDAVNYNIAVNCYAASLPGLQFQNEIPLNPLNFDVVILATPPLYDMEEHFRKIITSGAKKVIILDPEYSYRWIIDLNFEIKYRQNEVVLLQKVD